jgi:hypothetical protein
VAPKLGLPPLFFKVPPLFFFGFNATLVQQEFIYTTMVLFVGIT